MTSDLYASNFKIETEANRGGCNMADQDTAAAPDAASIPSRALLLDNDLFFVTKITDTLKHAGWATTTARRLEDFQRRLAEDRPKLALVNTAARGVDWQTAI